MCIYYHTKLIYIKYMARSFLPSFFFDSRFHGDFYEQYTGNDFKKMVKHIIESGY
jgi:hypothetical protein